MKKIFSLILAFLMLFVVSFAVTAAAEDNRIYSDPVSTEKGSTIEIPVKIENNTGIMGFAIDVSYDNNVLNPVSVEGSDSFCGMFNDSIETSDAGSFTVLYTGTESIESDGLLFTLKFKVSDSAAGNTSVNLSYCQEDTFDEEFSEVELKCESISVSVKDNNSEPDDPSDPTDPSDPPSDPEPGDDELKLSVRIKNWAAGLNSPWNTIMSVIVAPVVFVLQIFGR